MSTLDGSSPSPCSNLRNWHIGAITFGLIAFIYMNVRIDQIDPLNMFDEQTTLSQPQLHMLTLGFCLNFPLVNKMNAQNNATSNTPEEEYIKQSIYAVLYSMYKLIGETTSDKGIPYEFTFNTWGILGDYFPSDDPQHAGKEAYRRLTDFPEVHEIIENQGSISILEVGSGTGAGANLTTYLHPTSHYIALDMQKQAIQTCKRRHAHDAIPNVRGKLQCVQANGMNLPFPDNSFDTVLVSETHIAEYGYLTPEDLKILSEIERVLKPNGLFVWGNALVTVTWGEIEKYFQQSNIWTVETLHDVTDDAVAVRIHDADRVLAYMEDIHRITPIANFFPTCRKVIDRLILDFYRHPETRLFNNMVDRTDSYKQGCFRLTKD